MAQDMYGYGEASNDQERRVKGSEVFVGGLPRSTTENNIRDIFSAYGKIVELRMMKDQSGISKGFCFVRFSTKEAAFKALKEKDGTMLHGKRIGVAHSSDQDSLFFGNLRKEWSSEEFDKLVRQAFRDVVSVDLALASSIGNSHTERRHLNRGFAFVRFSSHAAAARAHRLGSRPDFLLSGDWHPVIDWAEKETEIDPEELAKIEKVALSRKCHFPVGFVHFVNRSDLNKAIKELDGKMVQGPKRGPDFKIQVSVAKPVEKDRKRVNEEIKSKPLNTPGARLDLSYDRHPYELPDHKSKVPRLADVITKPADPYEEAVIELPPAVKERLLRVLRLGIATRYDVDIKCIASLQVLPEPAATAVLDQFLISGGDKRDKGAYFASLVDKHRVDNLGGSIWDSSRLPLKPYGFAPKEPELYSLHGPLISPVTDLTASRYKPAAGLFSSQLKDESLLHRPSHGKIGETTYRDPAPSVLGYGGSAASSSYFDSALNSSIDRPTERPQMRFDPFTGQPYKFDPFTGEAIRPESHPHPSSRY